MMLLELLHAEARGFWGRIVVTAAISGAANAAILAIINAAAQGNPEIGWRLLVLFCAAVLLYTVCFRQSAGLTSKIMESALCKLRIRLADQIRHAELLGIEQLGTSEIYERLTLQTSIISNAAWPLAMGLQSIIMLACTVVYLAYTSWEALITTLLLYGLGSVYYQIRRIRVKQLLGQEASLRIQLFEVLNDLLSGFKEVRFKRKLSDELHADFSQTATALRDKTMMADALSQESYAFANLNQFALMGASVFVLPQLLDFTPQRTMEVISALIFMFGPLGAVMFALPEYYKASLAAGNVQELEKRVAAMASQMSSPSPTILGQTFQELKLEAVEFRRLDSQGQVIFSVGPIDLSVRAGEIVFLVGGNGSGKTTLLRTMTGLYIPTAGTISINNVAIGPANLQSFREQIAAIFTDFHLFRRLYGFENDQGEQVQKQLELMQIAHKTSLVDGKWTTVDLSTGQRKRIAMVVALLEDRPIYVFDEWAADQDPEFRRYFYEVLLVDLKRRGKAIIAISHDDRYFHCADKVVTLDYGKIRSIEYPHATGTSNPVC